MTATSRGMARNCASWINAIDRLPEAVARLRMVQIEHRDALDVIRCYDTPDTLHYLDPPYVHATRTGDSEYRYEMDDAQHAALVETILGLEGKVVLSGYRHALYEPLEAASWHVVEYDVHCYAVGRTKAIGAVGEGSCAKHRRTECVWLNPAAQARVDRLF